MPADIFGYIYAASIAAGGVLGYVKAQSIPSLGAGLLFGSVLGYGAYQTSEDPTNIALSVATNLALGGFMGYRYYTTQKVMPGGIAVLSGIALIRLCVRSLTANDLLTKASKGT